MKTEEYNEIVLNQKTIDQIAKEMVASQSFDFCNFAESKNKILSKKFYCVYDRLTLLIYEHNFSNESQRLLYKKIVELVEKKFCREDLKQRKELISLYNFIKCNSKYAGYKFRKELRPDFILVNDKEKVGVEITELTTQSDKIMDVIMKECSNKGLSEDQIRGQMKKRHGNEADNFDLTMFNDKMAIGGPIKNIAKIKNDFAEQILKKYNKYKNSICNFDDFIILCDARLGMEIICKGDAEEIFNLIKCNCKIKGVTVSIIYMDNNSDNICCSNAKF